MGTLSVILSTFNSFFLSIYIFILNQLIVIKLLIIIIIIIYKYFILLMRRDYLIIVLVNKNIGVFNRFTNLTTIFISSRGNMSCLLKLILIIILITTITILLLIIILDRLRCIHFALFIVRIIFSYSLNLFKSILH